MSYKRRLKRRHLIYYLSIFNRENDRLVGQLVDITTRGLMLTCERPLDDGIEFKMRMLLPDVIDGDNQINFDAKSVWCEKDINPNFFAVGFEFTSINRKTLNTIENLIQDFSFLD